MLGVAGADVDPIELTDEEDDLGSFGLDTDLGAEAARALQGKVNLSLRVHNDIERAESKGNRKPHNNGRDDRATSEQVLDPRTRELKSQLI